MKLINKNKFVETAFDENVEIFIANISSLAAKMIIYLIKKA